MDQWKQVEHWQEIRGKNCVIRLVRRPPYCERGKFLAYLETDGDILKLYIDAADGWPRYYFDEGRAKAEIEAWLTRRGQAI